VSSCHFAFTTFLGDFLGFSAFFWRPSPIRVIVSHRMAKVLRKSWPRVYRTHVHGKSRYVVDSRQTGFAAGRREYWKTSAEALASAELIAKTRSNEGAASFFELTPRHRRDAAEALALLEESGASLLDAARVFMRERERECKLAHVPTVDVAINTYLKAKRAEQQKGEISRLTLYEIESKMRIVRHEFGERKVNEIDEGALRDFVRRLPHRAQGKKNILTKCSQFLNFCRREGRWITTNPAEDIKVTVKHADVEILSVEQLRRLLSVAQRCQHPQSVIPYLSVQLFGGLRPFEAAALRWERINFETKQIEVKAETSKTRETRYVPLEEALSEWLFAYRKADGSILGPFFAETLRTVKRKAGFGKRRPWPKDVLRHCYGSYWLALYQDRSHLAERMGNTVTVIKRHYRCAIPAPVAREFWTLSPAPSKPAEIIELSAA
jgi:integrase